RVRLTQDAAFANRAAADFFLAVYQAPAYHDRISILSTLAYMNTPLLDLAALTAPIPGDQPAGQPQPPELRRKMDDARKDMEPHPTNPIEAPIPRKPEWSAIVKAATESLCHRSKDLRTAVRLVEALARRDGFAGLHAGFTLLRLYV